MKRFFALLLCLSILFSISAANNTGRIGIQFAAQGYIGTDESPANAQEVAISVSGANFLGKMEYSELDTHLDMVSLSMD